MRFRRGRCGRWPAPAFPTPARCSTTSSKHAPMRRSPTLDEVGGAALYLLSDLSSAVTGEVHFVDCGYSTIAMPNIGALKTLEQAERSSRPRSRRRRRAKRPSKSPVIWRKGRWPSLWFSSAFSPHPKNAARRRAWSPTCRDLPDRRADDFGETVCHQFGSAMSAEEVASGQQPVPTSIGWLLREEGRQSSAMAGVAVSNSAGKKMAGTAIPAMSEGRLPETKAASWLRPSRTPCRSSDRPLSSTA